MVEIGWKKIPGSDNVEEIRVWNVGWIIYVNDEVSENNDCGRSRKKSNELGSQSARRKESVSTCQHLYVMPSSPLEDIC